MSSCYHEPINRKLAVKRAVEILRASVFLKTVAMLRITTGTHLLHHTDLLS